MKNLRKPNLPLKDFKLAMNAPISQWENFSHEERIDSCVKFLLLPFLELDKPITEEITRTIMPSAVDLAHQAHSLSLENDGQFKTINDILEASARLFMLE